MVEQLKKAYSYRPRSKNCRVKVLQFLTPARIQKCLAKLQSISAFLTINNLHAELPM